ncbi:MAG TPA: efflux RND transporter periplasmic adaptor subunit [Candidatus Binatia bacterium]|nr:efflux RND transporter periplasmic adaptor subunit [Candidatus Binatia bacterium]
MPASALAAVLLASACGKPAPPALPPPEVLVSPVAQRNVPVYSEWVGTIEGYVNATIQPKVQGYLLTQNYKNGSVVKAGDLLFEIDPRQFQAAYDQAAANLAQAQAQLKKTQLDVARYKPLAAEGAVSQQELDDAVQQNDANAAAVEQAKAALENARLNLQWTKVQSPIPGIAGINQAQIGDLVGTTTVLTTVSTVDPIKVQFPIAEQEYLRFAARINRASETGENNGDAPKIELILADGSVYPQSGEIYAVNRQVDQRTGTLLVQTLFPNPDNILRPGGYAKTRAATSVAENAIVVPQRAVSDLQGTYQVYVLEGDKVRVRDVEPGPRTGSDWVITKGLAPGDKIVVEGVQKVRDGVTVVAKEAPPSDAPGMAPAPAPKASGAPATAAS